MSQSNMALFSHHKNRRGFTLIEILCVISIIAILMGLLMGPVARVLRRAQAMKWAQEAEMQLQRTVEQLQAHFRGRNNFPPVILTQLEARGWVGSEQIRFLKDRRVTYIPFAGTDPDDLVVIIVRLDSGFLVETNLLTETKGRITKPP